MPEDRSKARSSSQRTNMLVLPTDPGKAKQLMHRLHQAQQAVLAIAFGVGTRPKQVADLAELRAAGHRERQVVHAPTAQVLAGDALFGPLLQAAAQGAEVVFLTLDFVVARQLGGADALDASLHEEGFAAALAGDVA